MGVAIFGFKIIDDDGCISMKLVREIIAEMLGTFFLIILGCGGVQGAITDKPADEILGSARILQIGFAFGLGIGGIVHLFSDISGGQLNPAVSFGLFFARKLSLYRAAILSVAQIIGGIIGAVVLKIVFGSTPGVVAMSVSGFKGLILEFLGALFLVLTVLATINDKRGHAAGYLQPLSIGIAIFVAHMFLIPLTGCGINPARALATNIVAGEIKGDFYAYILGPILASAIGGLVYEFVFNPHYASAYEGIENGEGEEMK
ncbi:aquaporin-1-like [Bolinopsis microptera]|uniref:aquaporin-1-like n=1 Tax=Bolinopsis microptera TaxID=2820187 RepID=UPI0030799604